jgi:predicted O-methyltransferase YrrM
VAEVALGHHCCVTAGGSSIPAVQSLLRVVAGGRRRAAGLGAAFGEGAAAIAAGLAPDGTLVTVERDPERARLAREALAGRSSVRVLEGDWYETLVPHAPFDFLFVDVHDAKADPRTLELAVTGALFVLDDLTPGRPGPDPVRAFWLAHPPPRGDRDHDHADDHRNRRRTPSLAL